ncbi:MAG: hypothetical protein HYR84_13990 [Planctomycetes bacterium]|nr:hypothetical protein [Planctomycetota bacterium]
MKAVRLLPAHKVHALGYPFKVDVDDRFIDIDDATSVKVLLRYQATPTSPKVYSHDLPGNQLFLSGPWITVREAIREIVPTSLGFYTLVVEAYVNVAPPHVPILLKPVVYHGVPVHVEPR